MAGRIDSAEASSPDHKEGERRRHADHMVAKVLLGATAVMLGMAIFLVFVGTLAQVDKDMWKVIDEYFRAWICWVEWRVFFPPSFFPSLANFHWESLPTTGFPFPGGAAIGSVLFVLLAAAQVLNFRIRARGSRLAVGLAVLAAGVLATWLVIEAGHNKQGLQGVPFFQWSTLWAVIQLCLVGVWLVAAYYAIWKIDRTRKLEKWGLAAVVVGLGGVLLWMFFLADSWRPNDPSMRILWQLIQGGFAGVLLLAGCVFLFEKKAGAVVLHGGIGLMMFGELFVSLYAVEQRMTIAEKETASYAMDTRSVELTIVDPSPPDHDNVVAIPVVTCGKPTRFARGGVIQHEKLPFDVEILRFFENARLQDPQPAKENLATAGAGLRMIADKEPADSGADSGQVEMAAAYVKLTRKGDGEQLGVYLCAQLLAAQNLAEKVAVDGKTYDAQLRFQRIYKPYSIEAKEVRKDDYVGTSTPRNYSSDIRLVDRSRNVDFETRIWMNNPLRYAGETFYQSGYSVNADNVEVTDLQVVQNTGWMIPWVACMIVLVGMLAHFGVSLLRFLERRQEALWADELPGGVGEATTVAPSDGAAVANPSAKPARSAHRKRSGPTGKPRVAEAAGAARGGAGRAMPILFPSAVVLFCGLWFLSKAAPPHTPDYQMELEEFGKLPLVHKGRIKPFDTLARTSLRMVSGKQTFKDDSGREQPAIRWLLDVITQSKAAGKHRVFKIDNLEVLDMLGLSRRKGYRYGLDEFRPHMAEFEKQVAQARKVAPGELELYQRKLLELDQTIRAYDWLAAAFRPLPFPPFPSQQEREEKPDETKETLTRISELLEAMPRSSRILASVEPPLVVPVDSAEQPWQPYATAKNTAYVRAIQNEKVNPATLSLSAIFDAYAAGDARAFNRATAQYRKLLEEKPPKDLDAGKVRFEADFNHAAPFYYAACLYGFAFLFAVLGWLGLPRLFNRTAFWLVVLAFAVHTAAIIARIYISGRPPVTNLYSSAVVTGWGCVVLGLGLEVVYRLGIGNVIAAISGAITLIIAYFLSLGGDTVTVLLAVLDTQFWLAMHVVTITLGYSATFLAGTLGILYIFRGMATPLLSATEDKEISRMIYGSLCFAIFFSFVGTVLGGLWADDSWGRFWGWDPKENGALIIVLWNALVLHLRWARLIGERGLAALAVGGNIMTSWSWFGVNELGVGLHFYGFSEGVAAALMMFWISQLLLATIGLLPKSFWWSLRRRAATEAEGA